MTVTLGIMILWTSFFPPAQQAPAPEKSQPIPHKQVIQEKPAPEKTVDFRLGPLSLALGEKTAGVHQILVAGEPILKDAHPGFLQVDSKKEGGLFFETGVQSDELVSRGWLGPELEIVRKISAMPGADPHLFVCRVEVINRSSRSEPVSLRLVAYRPLHARDPHEHQFRQGLVSTPEKVLPIKLREGQSRNIPGPIHWVTSQGKSHALILHPQPRPLGMFHVEHPTAGLPVGWLELPETTLGAGEKAEWNFQLYAGTVDLSVLKAAGLQDAISFGAFSGISKLLLSMLNWSKGWLGNYGLAIIFIAFAIWLLFFPVTWSGIRMTKTMALLQPQVERIRKEHAKNPQKMNQEMLGLYKKYRVNPVSGCLPLLLQMPIFLALFQVLNRSPELKGAPFLWIRDLAAPDAAIRFSSPVPLLGTSFNVLPILMMVGMFVQQRMTQTPQKGLSPEQEMQQKMFKWFPLLFGFLFYGLPSGLVLYWVSNTVFTLGQYVMYSQFHKE